MRKTLCLRSTVTVDSGDGYHWSPSQHPGFLVNSSALCLLCNRCAAWGSGLCIDTALGISALWYSQMPLTQLWGAHVSSPGLWWQQMVNQQIEPKAERMGLLFKVWILTVMGDVRALSAYITKKKRRKNKKETTGKSGQFDPAKVKNFGYCIFLCMTHTD